MLGPYANSISFCLVKDRATLQQTIRLLLLGVVTLCLMFCTIPLRAAGKEYVVKRDDTLSGIARRHDVSLAALLKANPKVEEADKIYAGQTLKIPGSGPAVLQNQLVNELNKTSVPNRKWKYIVIHHSATDVGNAKSMDRYHREERHMENGLAYHFIIGNGKGMDDGEIVAGPRWTGQINGGHLVSESLNSKSIGICLVGNFDESRPTAKQLESLEALVIYLMKRCRLGTSAVRTHQQINTIHTRCPGRHFPTKDFLTDLKQIQG